MTDTEKVFIKRLIQSAFMCCATCKFCPRIGEPTCIHFNTELHRLDRCWTHPWKPNALDELMAELEIDREGE